LANLFIREEFGRLAGQPGLDFFEIGLKAGAVKVVHCGHQVDRTLRYYFAHKIPPLLNGAAD
jgi:hypothetical protein